MPFLRDYQLEAVNKLKNGNILCGGVGAGKSRTGLYYYFKEQGGFIDDGQYIKMNNPKDLYIITTAKKRDSQEWELEMAPYLIRNYDITVVVDSWNNIQKYIGIQNAFFLFDEQRVVGKGAWVKAFLKITKSNEWILLTATPGDSYYDYVPVFLANGYYRNRTEFEREHCVFNPYTKFKQIQRYVSTARLERLRRAVLVQMNYHHDINIHKETVLVDYDKILYKDVLKRRWNIWEDKPFQNASELCYGLRKITNSSEDRAEEVQKIVAKHQKVIIFYSFDYELDILKSIDYGPGFEIGELNGHQHNPVPDGERWVYLVNYTAGAEAWNCIKTNAMIFYSLSYSYKTMTQAAGRIDRMNTPFTDLYYYYLRSYSSIDIAISRALSTKKDFNMRGFTSLFSQNKQ